MAQTWNAADYQANGSFVPAFGSSVLALLAPQPGERILDLGCGDGQLTAQIAAAGAIVTGVDASPSMVAAARQRGIDAHLCAAEELPFAAEFDAVFSNAALHWVRGQDAMLAAVRKALKPGGRFVAEMGGHGNIAAISVALRAVLLRHHLGHLEEVANYFPTPQAYRRRLESHGFRVNSIDLIPRPTPLPQSGMEGWLNTFRRGVLDAVQAELRSQVVSEAVELLRPVLADDNGDWTADYVRLRFCAHA